MPLLVPRAIDAHTKLIALIGDPVEHSKSPVLQNAALEQLGLNVVNVALRVRVADLSAFVVGAKAAGFLGLMVTIPHKAAALLLADERDPLADLLGAANLLHFRGDGATVAYNTDVGGAEQALRDHGLSVRGTRFLVLGAGGAAHGLVLHFLHEGGQVALANRTRARAETLADEAVAKLGVRPQVIDWSNESLATAAAEAEVVINTTAVGMRPNLDESPLPVAALRPGMTVFDLVYNPLETRLLREARAAGAAALDGVGMLVYTNQRAVQICCGESPDVALMRAVCVESLQA